jgi:hypothetical protein
MRLLGELERRLIGKRDGEAQAPKRDNEAAE